MVLESQTNIKDYLWKKAKNPFRMCLLLAGKLYNQDQRKVWPSLY